MCDAFITIVTLKQKKKERKKERKKEHTSVRSLMKSDH